MQLESHATPQKETPQQRYATLHRAVERGLDSDEIWRELAEVSLRLGHSDESLDCFRRIRNPVIQQAVKSRLVRAGLLTDDSAPAPVPAPVASAHHAAAPAASIAGPKAPAANVASSGAPRLQDHVVDAIQYLFHQHMPLLVLMTTLAFPVVVGLGGFLTAGGSPFLLAAIAALPGLMLLAVVGAMGRQILVVSSQGVGDVPNVPEFGQLVADARRFLGDASLVLGSLLLPSLLALALGAPAVTTLPGLLIGAFFTPMAWALRQIRGDLGALSPTTLLRAVTRCGLGYFGLVPVCWLLFAPAATVAWIVFGRPVWVQIAMVGPLCVLPLFVASRLLGTWVDARRVELGMALVCQPTALKPRLAAAAPKATPTAQARPTAPAPRLPQRPAHLQHFAPPNLKRADAPAPVRATTPRATAPRAPAAAAAPARPAPAARKLAKAVPAPAPAPAAKPTTAPATAPRAIEGRGPRRAPSDQPDLSNLPGAVVVTGRERLRQGAAAPARPQ